MRRKKEIKFLELKQGIIMVVEYAAKFGELVKSYPHYNGETVEDPSALNLRTDCDLRFSRVLATRRFTSFLL